MDARPVSPVEEAYYQYLIIVLEYITEEKRDTIRGREVYHGEYLRDFSCLDFSSRKSIHRPGLSQGTHPREKERDTAKTNSPFCLYTFRSRVTRAYVHTYYEIFLRNRVRFSGTSEGHEETVRERERETEKEKGRRDRRMYDVYVHPWQDLLRVRFALFEETARDVSFSLSLFLPPRMQSCYFT